jgi:hypothetical protein
MREVAFCQRQWLVIEALFSRCSNVWWTILDEVLNDHVVNVRDDVVGFQHTLHAMHNLALMKVKSLHRLLHHQ